MHAVGVDGCRGGWLCVGLEVGPAGAVDPAGAVGPASRGELAHWVSPDFAHVVTRAADAVLVLVDIPIGLLEAGPGPRAPDAQARRVLRGKRASSVFPAPVRPVLRSRDYAAANARSRELTGKGLPKQTWMIAPKIREVDDLLLARPGLVGRVREVHPELCFHAFAGGRPMRHNKKTAEGFAERFALLAARHPEAERTLGSIVLWHGTAVARDDAVDALAAALTAAAIVADPRVIRTVPDAPEPDAQGIPMEMVFAEDLPAGGGVAQGSRTSL
jgi:predicted RNase H-like nuclease